MTCNAIINDIHRSQKRIIINIDITFITVVYAFLKICCNKENLNAIYKLTLFDGCFFTVDLERKRLKNM